MDPVLKQIRDDLENLRQYEKDEIARIKTETRLRRTQLVHQHRSLTQRERKKQWAYFLKTELTHLQAMFERALQTSTVWKENSTWYSGPQRDVEFPYVGEAKAKLILIAGGTKTGFSHPSIIYD